MKITKYEHACLVIEDNGKVLVLDPGVLASLPELKNVSILFITHIHGDHLDKLNIERIIKLNPEITILGSKEVLDAIGEVDVVTKIVNNGDQVEIDGFRINIGGNDHAVIYESSPCQNRTIAVNDKFYYPGDSFEMPSSKVDLVAVPASAPWLKSSEYMEFIKKIKVNRIFPTHNGLLSEFGEKAMYNWMSIAADEANTELIILKPGETVEV